MRLNAKQRNKLFKGADKVLDDYNRKAMSKEDMAKIMAKITKPVREAV